MDSSELTTEALQAASKRLAAGIAASEAIIADEQRKLAVLREEHHLISRLLELRTNGDAELVAMPVMEDANGPPALDAAIGELASAGRPLHISELFRTLQERCVSIPGSGQQANLIALLTRDQRIYRPERGFYALSQWRSEKASAPSRGRRVHLQIRKSGDETKND